MAEIFDELEKKFVTFWRTNITEEVRTMFFMVWWSYLIRYLPPLRLIGWTLRKIQAFIRTVFQEVFWRLFRFVVTIVVTTPIPMVLAAVYPIAAFLGIFPVIYWVRRGALARSLRLNDANDEEKQRMAMTVPSWARGLLTVGFVIVIWVTILLTPFGGFQIQNLWADVTNGGYIIGENVTINDCKGLGCPPGYEPNATQQQP